MKTLTKIAIAANAAVIAFAAYIYNDNQKQKTLNEAETISIRAEVEKQLNILKDLNCLATNIYHEARSEGLTGQRAVAWVTLNRMNSSKYPDNICGVVYQAQLDENGIPKRNKCSFSWVCDGKPDTVDDLAAWNVAESIANEVMNAYGKETDPTNGSIMYHAHYVMPYWASSYEKQARIDSHIFYN